MSLNSVAVLGTGLMGAPMARNLARAGLDVRVWNRTTAKAEELSSESGVVVAATPAEAAEGADVVLTMLFDAGSVEAAFVGPHGALRSVSKDCVWVQMSTVGVAGEQQLAALARGRDLAYVDAPVLGTRAPAEAGALTVLASGPSSAQSACDELFEPLSQRVLWLGEAGAGSRLKMVVNTWILSMTAAMAEAVALAEGLELDPRLFLDLLEGHPTDSVYARTKAESMLRRDFPASFPVLGALKDAGLVSDAMAHAGVQGRVSRATHEQFGKASDRGHGHEDMAAVYWAAKDEEVHQ